MEKLKYTASKSKEETLKILNLEKETYLKEELEPDLVTAILEAKSKHRTGK